jgi:hypothetical protein
VHLLRSQAADANAQDREGGTPLSLSVERDCIGIARRLLSVGTRMSGTAVLVATYFQQSAMGHFVLTRPFVDLNVAKTARVTALLGGPASGRYDSANGVAGDPRVGVHVAIADGITPLSFAIRRGLYELLLIVLTR